MFSRKPAFAAAAAASSPGEQALAAVRAALANPFVGAGATAAAVIGALGLLVLAAGDPDAGAPVVRAALTKIGATTNAPAGWREALGAAPEGVAAMTAGTFELSPETPRGHAVITVPGEDVPIASATGPLPPAPYPGLWIAGPGGGRLPVVAPDGRTPAQAYARPFPVTSKAKVALVIGGLGLNETTTLQAIRQLPPAVTLAFTPYSENLQGWIDMAREHGHEVLLEAPLEPNNYPDNDAGPLALMAEARPEETVRKLEWLLSRATGYFGLTNYLGSKFLTNEGALATLGAVLNQRGLAFIDDGLAARKGIGLRASADQVIDEQPSPEAIARQLRTLEGAALQKGRALGAGIAYPVTLTAVTAWTQGLNERGLILAPASAVTAKR